ncbi:MAG: penicillin acylase family protein, partial [Pseudomonadota bacterium]
WRRALHFTLVDTVNAFSVAAATAAPPADADAEAAMAPQTHTPQDVASLAEALRSEAASGSNAIAFGKAATGNGRGLLLGNPHFPWVGHERQYAAHVTVGDDYDMFGSLIYGLPVPLIGFNQDVAWSATYSTDNRVIIYDVTLDPNDPTRYLVDGESRAMRSVPVSVDVLQDDGTIEAREHIFWETEYGPVVTGGPLSWTKERAYTIFDANRGNLRNLDQWLDMGKSASVRELKDSMASIMGLQFSNIVAADRQGEALFANLSVAAKLPDRRLEDCITKPLGAGLLQLYSAIVADGSRSECQPLTTADAPAPGTVPASQRPFLFRDDYVIHSNDSHWAVNADPASFLTGFDRTLGEEKTPRGERFREGARLIEARLETDRFTAGDVHSMFYGATNMTGREIKAALLSHCAANETSDDVTAACAALRNWDGTAQPASRGAHLVREIMDRLPRVFRTPYILQDALWSTPFDPADPVSTPRDLIVDEPVLTAVTAAVTSMRERGIPLDGPLGDVQFFDVDGERLPAGGNPYALHLVRTTWDDTLGGYSHPVLIGDSFTHLVTFTDEGLDARFVLSYSQSTDPDSPHNDDQLPLYLSGDWIDLPFTDAEIEADPAFNSVRLQGD